jgi:UDP-glucose:(heptosyl)LPS alpha-1,3-glucosyltransferase
VPLRFALFYVIAAVRLAATRADVVHTLGAIVPNAAHLASVPFCTAGYIRSAGGLAPPSAPALRRANTALARLLFLAAERWTYRRARVDRLGAVSRGLQRELAESFPGVPILLTPNGVDRSRFRPDPNARRAVRAQLGIEDDDVVALFVGGDWHRKGLALAIQAAAEAGSRAPIRLLVVGRGDERRFTTLAHGLGIAQRVHFLGPRSDTERFYAAADVFLLPSWYETFSLAAFEAAASGLPIVAAPLSGVEELVGDGDAGMLVERDAGALGEALAALSASPETRRRLGASARERSAAYTWDRSADAVLSVYRSVLSGASAPKEATSL